MKTFLLGLFAIFAITAHADVVPRSCTPDISYGWCDCSYQSNADPETIYDVMISCSQVACYDYVDLPEGCEVPPA